LILSFIKSNRKLIENISSLGFIQFVNLVLPLLTLPYLSRVLGAYQFGVYAIIQSIYSLLIILSDYGFNLSATKIISLNRENKLYLSQYFWAIISNKLIISFFFTLIISFIHFCRLYNFSYTILLLISCLGVISNTFIFQWFFQGVEKTIIIAVFVFIARIFTFIIIVLFVKESNHTWVAILANSLGVFVCAILSLFFVVRKKMIYVIFPSRSLMINSLNDGWHLFVSSFSISLYSAAIPSIIGFLSNPVTVGIYSAADKLKLGLASFNSPISSAYFPRISYMLSNNYEEGICEIKRLFKITLYISIFFSAIAFFFSSILIQFFVGSEFKESAIVLKILAPTIVFASLSNVFGIQVLINLGKKKLFSRIIITASILSLILITILTPIFGALGAASSVLISEIFVLIIMYIKIKGIVFK